MGTIEHAAVGTEVDTTEYHAKYAHVDGNGRPIRLSSFVVDATADCDGVADDIQIQATIDALP